MKTSAQHTDGSGLVYRGPFVYGRSASGALTFGSAAFACGRITSSGVQYHVTDHLGSVVAVVSGADGSVLESGKYVDYGSRTDIVPAGTVTAATNRWHFSGKDDQSVDFGARHYSPSLGRWLVPDPAGEEYYEISPYVYCANDPVNLVDVDGRKHVRKWRRNTVTVSATIYTPNDKQSIQSAQLAANFWNNRKDDSYTKDGKTYKVVYHLTVSPTDKIKTFKSLNEGENTYEIREPGTIIDPKTGGNAVGETKTDPLRVKKYSHVGVDALYSIKKPESSTISSTGAHELGHALGIEGHKDYTLMSTRQDDKRSFELSQDQIDMIIESFLGEDDWISQIFLFLNKL